MPIVTGRSHSNYCGLFVISGGKEHDMIRWADESPRRGEHHEMDCDAGEAESRVRVRRATRGGGGSGFSRWFRPWRSRVIGLYFSCVRPSSGAMTLARCPSVAVTGQLLLNDCCTVCLENFEPATLATQLPCLHVFHYHCISSWMRSHRTCPICRDDVEISFKAQ